MRKTLLALAVAGAMPALAQAQTSGVTLYGIVDASVEYSNADANYNFRDRSAGDSGVRVQSGLQSGSRLGVRGTEDLGGGLRALFTIEHRFDLDTGDTSGGAAASAGNQKFWNGQAFAGLESDQFGRLTLGRQYSPLFNVLLPADFTVYGFYNNWAGLTGSGFSAVSAQGPIRLDNSVAYRSPTMGGLTLHANYAMGENTTGTGASGNTWGVAASYKMGDLYLAAGHHSFDAPIAPVAQAGPIALKNVTALAGSYNFGTFGASLGYSMFDYEGAGKDVSNVLVGGYANIGPGIMYVNAVHTDVSGFATLNNGKGLQLGAAYSIPMSKRTNVYAAIGMNDMTPVAAAGTASLDATRFAVGVRHMF
jgi:predicted porin